MASIELRVYPNAAAVAEAAADMFVQAANAAAHPALCLSGGRTPLALYRLLADQAGRWRGRVPWAAASFHWGDERWVPHTHADSNFGAAVAALFGTVPVAPEALHPFDTSLATPQMAAEARQRALRDEFGPEGPRFDLCLLGLGADGHTASLFPGVALDFAPGALAAALRVEALDAWRLTLTPRALAGARRTVFLVAGADKRQALARLLMGGSHAPTAALALPRQGDVVVLADREAAG